VNSFGEGSSQLLVMYVCVQYRGNMLSSLIERLNMVFAASYRLRFAIYLAVLLSLSIQVCGDAFALNAEESKMIDLINAERVSRGLSELLLNDRLSSAAALHCADIAARHTLTHMSQNGDSVRQRLKKIGYHATAYGEIIGRESAGSALHMLTEWLKSPPHAEILLSTDYTELGVASVSIR
jgi:uncharacterized protein YkwD